MDNFVQFNLIEGIFWIVLGLFLFVSYKFIPKVYIKLSLVAGVLLMIFGISDFVEIYMGGFLSGQWCLLIWKILNIAGLIAVAVWYFKLKKN